MNTQALLVLAVVVAATAAYRIDVHHHVLPSWYRAELLAAGGDPSGFPTPTWTETAAIASVTSLNITKAYISVSSPGALLYDNITANRDLARRLNVWLANYTTAYSSRFKFFAVLPSWTDITGTLAEIKYAHNLGCKGFEVYTSYGDDHIYIGNSTFSSIWSLLEHYKAWVHIHPSPAPKKMANYLLAQPVLDYPHETARAASDIVVSDIMATYPNIKMILSHGGGTLPLLAERIATGIAIMKYGASSSLLANTSAYYVSQFKKFYFDLALVTSSANIAAVVEFTNSSHVLFGSDYPYAPSVLSAIKAREAWMTLHSQTALLPSWDHENAEALGL